MTNEEILIVSIVGVAFAIALIAPISVVCFRMFWRPSEKIPLFGTRQSSVKGFFNPEETMQALLIFKECWLSMIDKTDTKPILDKLNIFWKKDPIDLRKQYKINGKLFSKAAGITRTKKDIDVWIYDKDKKEEDIKISGTALVHELIHIVLWNLYGDPDADHEGDVYAGWIQKHTELEAEVRKKLKEKGL